MLSNRKSWGLLAEQFEVIERNEREIDGALRKSEALRQAILQKAFTGRLVPQDPTDEPASALLARIRAERESADSASRGPKAHHSAGSHAGALNRRTLSRNRFLQAARQNRPSGGPRRARH